MRILVDGTAFQNNMQKGVQRVFFEILGRLSSTEEIDVWLHGPCRAVLPRGCRTIGVGASPRMRVIGGIRRKLEEWAMSRSSVHYDLFHSTSFTVPPDPSFLHIVTIYDMITERYPDLCGDWGQVQSEQKAVAIQAAKFCIAISQATADELKAFYPDAEPKIRVIPLGADHLASGELCPGPPSDWMRNAYILYVGDRTSYKNFRVLLEAMSHPRWPRHLRLVLVGPELTFWENLLIKRLGLDHLIRYSGRVSDSELCSLYRNTLCLVVTSLCEGFGFPVLEAQSLGTPVLCSDIAVFREVAGNSAAYFNPRIPESLAQGMQEMLDPHQRDLLSIAGRANAGRFRWEQCAQRTREVYYEAKL